jgi:hypothetical protein
MQEVDEATAALGLLSLSAVKPISDDLAKVLSDDFRVTDPERQRGLVNDLHISTLRQLVDYKDLAKAARAFTTHTDEPMTERLLSMLLGLLQEKMDALDQAAAERERADNEKARADNEKTERLASDEASAESKFFALVDTWAAGNSDVSKSNSNHSRLNFPYAVGGDLADVLKGLDMTKVISRPAQGAWEEFTKWFAGFVPKGTGERALVHPIVGNLLKCAIRDRKTKRYKLVCEKKMEDDVTLASMIPDFSILPLFEASYTASGADLILEAKGHCVSGVGQEQNVGETVGNPTKGVNMAVEQVEGYDRRNLRVRLHDARERGDRERMSSMFAIGAGTDGETIIFTRTSSGVPPPGESFKDKKPYPTIRSKPFKLLTYAKGKYSLPKKMPEGFELLVRLFDTDIFEKDQRLYEHDENINPGDENGNVEQFKIDRFIGTGGFCDVYSLKPTSSSPEGRVAKINRTASEGTHKQLESEIRFLTQLKGVEGVSQLVRHFERGVKGVFERDPEHPWNVLVIKPLGTPLPNYANGVRDRGRNSIALDLLQQVLATLKEVHAKKILHGDIRPGNIVVTGSTVEGREEEDSKQRKFVLVDFGMSCDMGQTYSGANASAFGSRVFFSPGPKPNAHPAFDVISLCWTCVAFVTHLHSKETWYLEGLPAKTEDNRNMALAKIKTNLGEALTKKLDLANAFVEGTRRRQPAGTAVLYV